MRLAAAAIALLTVACTTVPTEESPAPTQEPPAAGEGGAPCSIAGLELLLGRAAAEALGAEALRRSGAGALRWIRPGDMVTMDYREDRLNIHLDSAGRVERFACG